MEALVGDPSTRSAGGVGVGVLGPGVPRLAFLQPHSVAQPTARDGPASSIDNSRPSRGAKPREADDIKSSLGTASLGWLPRSGNITARCTSRGSHDVSHDDQGQAGASGRSVPVSSLVLRRQAQTRSPEESSKGFHSGATRPRPPGRRSSRSPPLRQLQSFLQAKTTFVRITCTSCLPSNLAVVGSLPAYNWDEDQGHYK